jgi:hypothetical protein
MGGFANGITIWGEYAFVSDETTGLKIIDIRNPRAPKIVASYDTPGEAVGGFQSGDYIFVPDTFSLIILKVK